MIAEKQTDAEYKQYVIERQRVLSIIETNTRDVGAARDIAAIYTPIYLQLRAANKRVKELEKILRPFADWLDGENDAPFPYGACGEAKAALPEKQEDKE